MLRKILIIFVSVILIFSAGCSNKNKAAAVVNGVEIKMDEFESTLEVMKNNLEQQGIDTKSKEAQEYIKQMERQVIDYLIGMELLVQEAVKEGYTVSDEEINTEFDSVKSNYEDENKFNEVLEYNHLTEESFRQMISEELLIDKYIDGVIGEAEITEEEIREQYDYFKGIDSEIGEYDEIKDEIRDMIKLQRKEEATWELVGQLKEKSEITILIKGL